VESAKGGRFTGSAEGPGPMKPGNGMEEKTLGYENSCSMQLKEGKKPKRLQSMMIRGDSPLYDSQNMGQDE